MDYSIVIEVNDINFFIKTLPLFKKYLQKNIPIYLLLDVNHIYTISFLNNKDEDKSPIYFIDKKLYNPFTISFIIKTPVYLYIPSYFIPINDIKYEKDKLPCSLEYFPHDDLSTLSNRNFWFNALETLNHPINGDIFEYSCMTRSPQFIIKDVIQKEKSINSIELYWFYLLVNKLNDIYSESKTLWIKDLCFNVYHKDVPECYKNSQIENGIKTDTSFIKIVNEDGLLNLLYKHKHPPNSDSLKSLMLQLNLYSYNKNLLRAGEMLDGGYVIADIHVDTIYGIGVGNTYKFEKDVLDKYKGKRAHLYDPTVDIHIQENNICHNKVGIDFYKHEEYNSLENLIKENNDWDNNNMLLKIDVEGYEWNSLLYTTDECLLHFKQIVIELHYLDTNFMGSTTHKTKMLEKINKHFRLIHVHGTNCCKSVVIDNFLIHPVIECTFVRNDLLTQHIILRKPKLPIRLDAPVDGMLKEVVLSNYFPYNY